MNRMSTSDAFAVVLVFLVWALIACGVGGWIANIVKLFGVIDAPVTGLIILRGIGVVVPPLGAILGWL